ncbi:MAG: ribosome maturation factor RimM [Gaiellaceae bacterium]
MPAERNPDVVAVGRVGRPHGIDGAFVVEHASDDPRRFEVGAVLLVNGEPARIVLSRRAGRGRPAIKLDRAVQRGTELSVRREDLPPPASGSFYVADLVGLQVVEEGGAELGVVRDVISGVANDVLELDSGLLLPLVEDCVRSVDLEQRRVLVAPGFADHG